MAEDSPARLPSLSPAASELANRKHALNVLVPEWTFLLAKEAAREDQRPDKVSGVVRTALIEYLEHRPDAEYIRELAAMACEHGAYKEAARADYEAQRAALRDDSPLS